MWLGHVAGEWNGTVLLFTQPFGMTAQGVPDKSTRQELLEQGYALVASSFSGPSLWALDSAVDDGFAAPKAIEELPGVELERTIAPTGPWAAW